MMSRKYVLIPALVTLVVLVVSLYPTANVTRKASAAPRAAVVTKYLMIPAAAFNATDDRLEYYNSGSELHLRSGSGDFAAPVYLPAGARIRIIKLLANDGNTSSNFCAYLVETHPKSGNAIFIDHVCTTGSSGKQQPVKYISHYVKWYYGYTIWLTYPASISLDTYAVMLRYTVNQ
jgi:hypothetical protein